MSENSRTIDICCLEPNVTVFNRLKYNRLVKEAKRFTVIFNDFITKNSKDLNVDDYIMCLRTHLLMTGSSLKKINRYIKNIVMPNLVAKVNESMAQLRAYKK